MCSSDHFKRVTVADALKNSHIVLEGQEEEKILSLIVGSEQFHNGDPAINGDLFDRPQAFGGHQIDLNSCRFGDQ